MSTSAQKPINRKCIYPDVLNAGIPRHYPEHPPRNAALVVMSLTARFDNAGSVSGDASRTAY